MTDPKADALRRWYSKRGEARLQRDTGGAGGGGTVFQLTPAGSGSWSLSALCGFDGSNLNGPYRTLTMDNVGNLYGTTSGRWHESVRFRFSG